MIRALHLVKTQVGARWALQQMKELVRLGIEVHVALPGDEHLAKEYRAAGVSVHALATDFPLTRPWRWRPLAENFRTLVSEVRPDILHSHFVGTTLTMRLALGRDHPLPRIFQVPGPLHLEHAFFREAEIRTAGPRDYWVGSCRWTCERYIRSGVPRGRVFHSVYGADVQEFKPANKGKLRSELGLAQDTRIVGMVGFMYAPKWWLRQRRGIKGHEDLIDALAICLRMQDNLVGVFIGGPWKDALGYERRVRGYARRKCLDRAIFLGTRTDVPELYPDMDVAVHPSRSENLGGAGESLLSGVPTVTTNVGGFPDLVIPWRTGWQVPARDPQRLAEAILEVLGNPTEARAMAARGRQHALDCFDVRTTAKEILTVYEKLIHNRPHALELRELRFLPPPSGRLIRHGFGDAQAPNNERGDGPDRGICEGLVPDIKPAPRNRSEGGDCPVHV